MPVWARQEQLHFLWGDFRPSVVVWQLKCTESRWAGGLCAPLTLSPAQLPENFESAVMAEQGKRSGSRGASLDVATSQKTKNTSGQPA